MASLACADTNNDLGMAGAGYNCRLVIEKTDFSDSSIAASIVDATDRGVKALNMSFGPSVPTSAPAPASEVRALKYAAAHKVVLVAAAADSPGTEQGDPANVLQPAGTGPHLADGIGLDVTAARYNGTRAPFSGTGTEISLAAYGAFRPGNGGPTIRATGSQRASSARFPGNTTQLEQFPPAACRVDFMGDDRYATVAGDLDGGSTGCRGRGDDARAQPVRVPARDPADHQADRPAGPSPRLEQPTSAGASSTPTRHSRRSAGSILRPRIWWRRPPAASRSFLLTWSGSDPRRPELIRSGIAYFQLYVSVNGGRRRLIAHTSGHRLRFDGVGPATATRSSCSRSTTRVTASSTPPGPSPT